MEAYCVSASSSPPLLSIRDCRPLSSLVSCSALCLKEIPMRRPLPPKRALFVCVNAALVTVLVLQSTAPLWATPSLPTTPYELTSEQGADPEASTTATGAEATAADDVERADPAAVAQQEPPPEPGDLILVAPVSLTLEAEQRLLEPGDTTTLTVGATRAAQEGAEGTAFTLELTLR